MLATIRDDTWNVLNMQHKSQIRKDGIIQTFPVVAINIQAYWWNGKINDTHITGLVNVFRWGWIEYKVHITRQIWGIWKLRPAYSPETLNLGQNRWCFVPCDLEIWWMTLEKNRASFLWCFKLCATFHSHWWIQTGVTVRKRPIWVKFDDF